MTVSVSLESIMTLVKSKYDPESDWLMFHVQEPETVFFRSLTLRTSYSLAGPVTRFSVGLAVGLQEL